MLIQMKMHMLMSIPMLMLMVKLRSLHAITDGDCVDHFELYANTMSQSGMLKSTYTSVDTCKAGCLQDDTCKAVDFQETNRRCYFHGEGFLTSAQQVMGVSQYRRVSCDESESHSCTPIYFT